MSTVFRDFEVITAVGQDRGSDVFLVTIKDGKKEAVLVMNMAGVETFLQQMIQSSKLYWDHMQARINPNAVHPRELLGTACVHCGGHIAQLPHVCPRGRG